MPLFQAACQTRHRLDSDPATGKRRRVTPEVRYRMIAEAAYYLAEKRNFRDGDPLRDWLEAEIHIDRLLLENSRPRLALQFLPMPQGGAAAAAA